MLQYIKKYPFFVITIPLFFILHGFLENFGFITIREGLLLAAVYCSGAVLLYLLLLVFFRNAGRAGLVAAYLLVASLFFGACQDFLTLHAGPMGKYSVLLSLLLLLFIVVIWAVRKSTRLSRPILLLNLVFITCTALDAVLLAASFIHPPPDKLSVAAIPAILSQPITGAKPDIYYLIFDEYASSLSLRQCYGYQNDLDAWLQHKGFRVQANSASNYNYTQASVASMLNLSYINGIKDSSFFTIKDMNHCMALIRENEVIKFLSRNGYDIINCSTFDLAGNPAPVSEILLPVKTRLITANTLWERVYKDLGWVLVMGKFEIKWLSDRRLYQSRENDLRLLDMIKKQSSIRAPHPVFVFGHIYMPHEPFYCDKNGRLKDRKTISGEANLPASAYLDYLTYTNTVIKQLIDTIQQNTRGQAAIILMGDHGFRQDILKNIPRNYQDMNAVYFPARDYHLWQDSITCVNQFRITFNTLFHSSIPLLKDSTIFLNGKQ